MEPFGTQYAKAIDDLSAKIFFPALICSLWAEFGPKLQQITGYNFFIIYVLLFISGFVLAILIMQLLLLVDIFIMRGTVIGPYIGLFLMPLGFAGLLPEYFEGLNIPYTQVTGVAILAWSFMLVKGGTEFDRLFWWNDDH